MTKTKHKTSRKRASANSRAWVLVLVVILIIIAVIAAIVCLAKPQSIPSEPSTPTTSNQPASTPTHDDTDSPAAAVPDDNPVSTPEAPEKAPQYEGENPNNLEELTGVITYKGVENGTLTIMTMLHQYLRQTGLCVITLTGQNTQSSYTASVDAHGDATASYCENFDIPASALASDTYTVEIKLTGDGKTGTIRDEVKL